MAERPALVIRAKDFGQSYSFYTEGAGYTAIEQQPAEEWAIIDVEGSPILIAGPNLDLSTHAADSHRVLRQGITRASQDVDTERARWEQWGYSDITSQDKPWGDRELHIHTPEGLTLAYAQAAKRTTEQEIAMLADLGSQLEGALEGLADNELDLKREESSWSIRQIVHHLSDTQGNYLVELKVGLCNPGTPYAFNWQNNVITSDGLHYTERPIGSAVSLFNAACQNAAELLRYYPNYRELSLLFHDGTNPGSTPTKQGLGESVSGMLSHSLEHIYEIKEIRKASE